MKKYLLAYIHARPYISALIFQNFLTYSRNGLICLNLLNLFLVNVPILYPLKTPASSN